jgi:hypothetical protein
LGGCSLKSAIDSATVDVEAKLDVKGVLRALFPKLTEDEIAELATRFDLEDALKLEAELEEARAEAEKFSKELFLSCEERVKKRQSDLADANDGYPETLEAVGGGAFLVSGEAVGRLDLSGLFSGKDAYSFGPTDVSLTINGEATASNVSCLADGEPFDLVFLVDVTGSMSNVIDSVRNSLLSFVSALKGANLKGTLSVVSYQDTVGVQVAFQELEKNGYERSPFIAQMDLSSTASMDEVERFIAKLEANRGADGPENLSAAVDFAQNSVIGQLADGSPNVIGDGEGDPVGTAAFPKLANSRQIFVAITDAPFHSDSRTPDTSSLLMEFKPRPIDTIVASLREKGTVVHVVDPSFVDGNMTSTGAATEVSIDADYFAKATGGIGEDKVLGYSLTDLELVAVASDAGLLDIALHNILKSSCRITFAGANLNAGAKIGVSVSANEETFSAEYSLVVQ